MKKWIRWVGIVTVVAGCSSVAKKSEPVKEIKPVEEKPVKTEKQTSIDPNTLYLLLAAELAGQRKKYDIALDAYLQAAKRVNDPRVAERAARIALYLKDQERTEQAVKLWLKEDPDNLTARKIALLSALRNADTNSALEQLNAYLALDPAGFESVLLDMAKVMTRNGREQQMGEILTELAKQHPDQASIYYVQALLSSKQLKHEVALEQINQALAIEPNWKKAIILRAQIAVRAGFLDKAELYLQDAIDQYPDDVKFKKMLAQVYMQSKKYDQALDIYQDILDQNPDDAESKFAMALINLQQEDLDKAKRIFKELAHLPAWEAQSAYYLGRIALKQGRVDEALGWFDSISSGPYKYDARIAAISLLMDQKRYDDVARRLEELEHDFPNKKLTVLLLKSELYNATEQFKEAFELLTAGLKQYPDNKDLLYTRALIADQLDKLDIVEQDLHKILQKYPDDAAALNALGYTLVEKTQRYDEAEKYLKKALSIKPDSAVIIDSYGWLKYKQGDIEQALQLIRKAYELQPETEIAAHLAEILWKKGEHDQARAVYEKAVVKNPDDKYLLKFKKEFLHAAD